jgi:hypothetical protein
MPVDHLTPERAFEKNSTLTLLEVVVVFYELLTRELPIGRFPVPSETIKVNVKLDHVVLKALEKDPQLRTGKDLRRW